MAVSQATLELTSALSETLRELSCQGLVTLRAGAEIGGLLTASKAHPSDYDIRLVDCDHQFGPFWKLSAEERSQLRETARQTLAEGRVVVAYFRSCNRSDIVLQREDRENIAFACPAVAAAVLVKPSRDGGAELRVFTHDARQSAKEAEWEIVQSISIAPPPKASAALPEIQPVNRRRWVASAIVIVLAVGIVIWRLKTANSTNATNRYHPDPQPLAVAGTTARGASRSAASRLGLVVNEENGKLHAMWDHDSPAARAAIFGSLEIREGGKSRIIGLSPADIKGGSIVYKPRSADITFRLVLTDAGVNTTEEMLRFLGSETPGTASRGTATIPAPPPVSRQPFQAPRSEPAPLNPKTPQIIDAPTLELSGSLAPVSLPPLASVPAPAVPVPTPAPPRAIAMTPPVPVHQSWPTKADRAYLKLNSPVTVGVIVHIDERGRVTKALPATAGRVAPFLVGLSVNAAERWIFRPATRDGRPVASEYSINFRFQPDASR